MKIVLIHQKYNAFGGGALVLSDIINFYASNPENEVTIIVRHWKGDLLPNVKVVSLDGFYIGSILRDALFARMVKKYLAKHKFDVVISDQKIDGIDVYIAGGGVHKTYLSQRRSSCGFLTRISTYLRLFNYYTLYTESKLFNSFQLKLVICVSDLVRRDISANYTIDSKKLSVVHNGINVEKFYRNDVARSKIRSFLQLKDMFTLVFVGSGYERKGLYKAIEALKFLPDTCLLVLGKDNKTKKYQRYAEELGVFERCHFLGAKSPIVDYYSASDAFILPSSYEPFGLVYVEALANGLPVLVSDMAGASEIIEEGNHGYIIKHDDTNDIVEKINLLRNHQYNVNACLELAGTFTVELMVENMNAAIRSVSYEMCNNLNG